MRLLVGAWCTWLCGSLQALPSYSQCFDLMSAVGLLRHKRHAVFMAGSLSHPGLRLGRSNSGCLSFLCSARDYRAAMSTSRSARSTCMSAPCAAPLNGGTDMDPTRTTRGWGYAFDRRYDGA